jgi:hypothetical protein
MADSPEGTPPTTDFLDQSEIDKLLAQAVESGAPRQQLIRADGQKGGSEAALKVEPYDFRNPAFLSEVELRRLRLLHEDFIRYLSARLSLYMRMEFGLKMAQLTTVSYSKFTENLPNPTHLSMFKVEPLIGVGILDINPRLALTIADRLLGGRGHSVKADRYLTEIEVALIEDVIMIILEEWCGQWKADQELRPLIIGQENNGRFLQTSPKDADRPRPHARGQLRGLLRADPDRRPVLHDRAGREADADPPPEGFLGRPGGEDRLVARGLRQDHGPRQGRVAGAGAEPARGREPSPRRRDRDARTPFSPTPASSSTARRSSSAPWAWTPTRSLSSSRASCRTKHSTNAKHDGRKNT